MVNVEVQGKRGVGSGTVHVSTFVQGAGLARTGYSRITTAKPQPRVRARAMEWRPLCLFHALEVNDE